MFYRTSGHHGLPHSPFKSCVVPRPIGWVTTLSPDGVVNLAPYSFFNAMSSDPPIVVVGSNGHELHGSRDTVRNIEATGEFVCNLATWDLRKEMNTTSAPLPAEIDELSYAGLTSAPSEIVRPPRVAESPIHLECVHLETLDLPINDPKSRNAAIFGHVVGIHIDEAVLTDGLVDISKVRPIARLGYMDYAVVTETFTMRSPNVEATARACTRPEAVR